MCFAPPLSPLDSHSSHLPRDGSLYERQYSPFAAHGPMKSDIPAPASIFHNSLADGRQDYLSPFDPADHFMKFFPTPLC
jgi:hypothetical protein